MQPPYRSFALLELPFTFTPIVEHTPLKENELEESHEKKSSKCQKKESTLRAHIANIYDPVQLKECLQDKNFSESHSFIHHHHHQHHNNNNYKYNSVNEKERANSLVIGKENSTENNSDNNSRDKSMLSSKDNYTNNKRSRSHSESRENNQHSEVDKEKNEHSEDSKELYLAIGDSNEYWSENMYSGWCQAQD